MAFSFTHGWVSSSEAEEEEEEEDEDENEEDEDDEGDEEKLNGEDCESLRAILDRGGFGETLFSTFAFLFFSSPFPPFPFSPF